MTEIFEGQPPTDAPPAMEQPPTKTKRKRKPLTPEQKAKLVERLRLAREAKKAKKAKDEPVKEKKASSVGPAPEPVTQAPAPPPNKPVRKRQSKAEKADREKQLEISALRAELEIQKLKNDLDSLRKKDKPKVMPSIKEEVEETVAEPVSKQEDKLPVIPQKEDLIPPKPDKIKASFAPRNIWDSF